MTHQELEQCLNDLYEYTKENFNNFTKFNDKISKINLHNNWNLYKNPFEIFNSKNFDERNIIIYPFDHNYSVDMFFLCIGIAFDKKWYGKKINIRYFIFDKFIDYDIIIQPNKIYYPILNKLFISLKYPNLELKYNGNIIYEDIYLIYYKYFHEYYILFDNIKYIHANLQINIINSKYYIKNDHESYFKKYFLNFFFKKNEIRYTLLYYIKFIQRLFRKNKIERFRKWHNKIKLINKEFRFLPSNNKFLGGIEYQIAFEDFNAKKN